MLRIILCRILHWLFEVGRNSFIEERDRETNMACACSRLWLENILLIAPAL